MELFVVRCHRTTSNYIDVSSRPPSSPEIKVIGFPGHLRRRVQSVYGERIWEQLPFFCGPGARACRCDSPAPAPAGKDVSTFDLDPSTPSRI